MNYDISDLHGCYDRYKAMLKKLGCGPEDKLYFPGDAIDRGCVFREGRLGCLCPDTME